MATRTTDIPGAPRTPNRGPEYHDIRPVSHDWGTESNRALHALWRLGRNIVLCWAPRRRGIEVLIVPFHIVPDFAATEEQGDGNYNIKGCRIADKHGRTRDVLNAKITISREKAEPVFLGTQDMDLAEYQAVERRNPAPRSVAERAARNGRAGALQRRPIH